MLCLVFHKEFVLFSFSWTGLHYIVLCIFSFFFFLYDATADTTRPRRSQESDGVEYIFISKHLFETDVQNNKYVEEIF